MHLQSSDTHISQKQSLTGSDGPYACVGPDTGYPLQLALGIQCIRAAEDNKLTLEIVWASAPVSPTCADSGRQAPSGSLVLA